MMFGMVRVPAPRHTITRENTVELSDPSLNVVLTNLPGDETTLRIFFPGEAFGVDAEDIYYVILRPTSSISPSTSPPDLIFGFLESAP